MAATLSHASSTDDLLTNDEFEMEKKQQCSSESPNHYDSDDNHNGVLIMGTSQRTKSRLGICCTGKRVNNSVTAAIFVAVLSLAVIIMLVILAVVNIALIMYVGELHHRMDRLESQCSSVGTFLTTLNKTQLNSSSELEDHGVILLHLSMKLENVAERMPIFENKLIQLNSSLSSLRDTLSSELLLLANADEATSKNLSDFQKTLGYIEEDVDLTKIQLQNLSSMYTNLQSDYNATTHDIHKIRADIKQNVSQLHALIGQVEKNHSSSLVKLSRCLDEAAMNSSMLTQRIDHTSKLVGSQGQIINEIRSDVTEVQGSVTGLHDKLTTDVKNLDARINDHVDKTRDSLDEHSQTLNNFESQMHTFEWKLARLTSDAAHVVPLRFLLLSAIALLTFVCYVTL